MSKWIRKGDKVLVITGNCKGKTGEVLSKDENRVVIQGVNIRKKHLKRTQQTQTAQIVDMEMPVHISNVALVSETGKKIKPKINIEKGKKQLIYFEDKKKVVLRELKNK